MDQNLQYIFLKKFFRKEDEEGFSLIELVVVVAVLAVLAAWSPVTQAVAKRFATV